MQSMKNESLIKLKEWTYLEKLKGLREGIQSYQLEVCSFIKYWG